MTERAPVAESVTYAKRDLKAGDQIDGLGGFSVYGMIERADVARQEQLLPLGLAPGSTLIRDVERGAPVTYSDVQLDERLTIVMLRRTQDQMVQQK